MCIESKTVLLPLLASSSSNTINEATGSNGLELEMRSKVSASKHRWNEDCMVTPAQSPLPSKRRKIIRYSTCICHSEESCQLQDECCHQSQLLYRPNRKVHFGGHKTFVPAIHSLSEDDAKHLWYGLEECADMNEASKTSVRDYREQPQHKDMLRHVHCVASQCSYSPPPLAYLQAVRLNLPVEARGLELGLLPIRTRQRRQEHVRKVVHVQNQIVAGKIPIKNDQQIKAKALAIQSMRSSQASRLFAQLLARNVAQDEEQPQQ
jgi:hypothetical protein